MVARAAVGYLVIQVRILTATTKTHKPYKEKEMTFFEGTGEHLVFVYGSLKKNFINHKVLDGAKFIGAGITLSTSFEMFSLGSFPAVVHGRGRYAICGELYKVNAECLRRIDYLESNGTLYTRQEKAIVNINRDGRIEDAWMYIWNFPDITEEECTSPENVKTWVKRNVLVQSWTHGNKNKIYNQQTELERALQENDNSWENFPESEIEGTFNDSVSSDDDFEILFEPEETPKPGLEISMVKMKVKE